MGDEVYDFILNYYEKSPDENIQVIERDDEVEQEEGTLPHDMKKDLCMNGYYYGTTNKKMYEELRVGKIEAQILWSKSCFFPCIWVFLMPLKVIPCMNELLVT